MAACGANITHVSGIVTSPSYPDSYPHMADCIYLIYNLNGSYINFTLVNMDIACEASTAVGDYLELRDGMSANSPLIGRFCGIRSIPVLMQTSHSYIRAR